VSGVSLHDFLTYIGPACALVIGLPIALFVRALYRPADKIAASSARIDDHSDLSKN